ncbi:macrophage-expressed gene 1 protein-like, partial [Micropterus dolomieu]|uniref:macrophage-expressed gene 1 protein-like n=1 Tax=Micropterus dolomieu TaxID=147949 RepID=UPI001E8D6789
FFVYLSEKMVLDYGTHVITSVDAGATLVQEDYLSSSYVSDSVAESSSMKAQAGLNFFDKLKFDISSQSAQQSSSLQTYQSNIQYSLIQSHGGGTPFYPGITLQKWQESTRNNLVAIDRSGFPLHYFINTNTFPDLPQPTVGKVAVTVSQAIERYYKVNTRPGCHRQVCQDNYHVRSARINTYWCSVNGQAPDNSGYLFGGIYSPSLLNPLTNAKSCPPNFIPVKFLSDGQVICVSNDYETATRYSVPFGGLFSCQSSNPLAGFQRRCPPKFSQHLATVSDGCEILYCVQSGLFTGGQLLPIHLPPFTKRPLVSMQATNTVLVMTEGDKSWVRVGQTKAWKLVKPEEIKDILKKLNPELNQMSSGEKAGIAFGVIGLMVLVVLAVLLVKRRRRLSGFRTTRGYEQIRGEVDSQETQHDEA